MPMNRRRESACRKGGDSDLHRSDRRAIPKVPLACACSMLLLFVPHAVPALAQGSDVPEPSATDLIVLFSAAILFVAGIVIYMTRDLIRRKSTGYDEGRFDSQRNRDYEKYHSDWGDESAAGAEAYEEPDEVSDLYGILGVGRDASMDEIKRRYRELAKAEHPDRSGTSSEGRMAEINRAYEVLSDADMRARYDRRSGSD